MTIFASRIRNCGFLWHFLLNSFTEADVESLCLLCVSYSLTNIIST